MFDKLKKVLFLEKIPGIVCAMACLASALAGFTVGYIFLVPGEPLVVYGDTAAVYQPGVPYLAAVPELNAPLPELNQEPVHNNFTAEDPVASHLYIVTILGGYIAIYHAEAYGGGLKEVTSTAIGALAPEEQERLAEGIKIYTEEALAMILQDYGS